MSRSQFRSQAIAFMMAAMFASSTHAAIKTQEVEYEHGGVKLQGFLAYDDASAGKRPGVLVVHEWWGQTDYPRRRAEQLARLGYVALAIDMYGNRTLAKSAEEAGKLAGRFKNDRKLMRERAAAGLDVLRKQQAVDPSKVAAIGYCFGGTVALELARSGADLAGVCTFHGVLDTPNPADARNIKGKVLVCHGADDPFVPAEQVQAFEKEMRDAKVDWQLIAYGGAVHAFTNPDVDKIGLPGTAYSRNADRRSWKAMQVFFDEIFGNSGGRRAGL
jgi:dienelactone hydrolase